MDTRISRSLARCAALQFGRGGLARFIGVRLALVAIAIQCFVVQPHFDGAKLHLSAGAQISASLNATRDQAPGDTPTSCIICQEEMIAGSTILPPTPVVSSPTNATAEVNAAPTPAPLLRTASHIWQSRAPPILI